MHEKQRPKNTARPYELFSNRLFYLICLAALQHFSNRNLFMKKCHQSECLKCLKHFDSILFIRQKMLSFSCDCAETGLCRRGKKQRKIDLGSVLGHKFAVISLSFLFQTKRRFSAFRFSVNT